MVSNIFYFHPYLGEWSNLTNIFRMGWNHQLDTYFHGSYRAWTFSSFPLQRSLSGVTLWQIQCISRTSGRTRCEFSSECCWLGEFQIVGDRKWEPQSDIIWGQITEYFFKWVPGPKNDKLNCQLPVWGLSKPCNGREIINISMKGIPATFSIHCEPVFWQDPNYSHSHYSWYIIFWGVFSENPRF